MGLPEKNKLFLRDASVFVTSDEIKSKRKFREIFKPMVLSGFSKNFVNV